jgi:DNA-binding CsgD family transcriptional regulator
MLIDAHARVIQFNACVRFGDGLDVAAGYLQASRTQRERLQLFLAAVTRLDSGAAMTLALQRPSGLRPWLIDGIGCSAQSTESDEQPARAALLMITDVERPPRLSVQLLSELFGFTATEAKVARELISGRSLQDISAFLDISEGHARQRLKAIFDKTGTSRQGELIALLARLN